MSDCARLAGFGTATLAEAWAGARVVQAPPRPLSPEMVVAAPAYPLRCLPGDNLAFHLAIASAPKGSVLVMDYGADLGSGPFGEIMAFACQMRGLAGLITNGAVRDSRQIVELGLPVFAAGLNILGTTKRDRGSIGTEITLGGVRIAPGDIVMADADGAVVIDGEDLGPATLAAEARAMREAAMMERLREGETTLEILGLG